MTTAHPPAATWRKVGVRDGDRLVLLRAPPAWSADAAGAGVIVTRRRPRTPADVVVAFFRFRLELDRAARTLGEAIAPDGMVWVAWPRRAGGHHSDLGDGVVRAAMLCQGLVDVKVAALDEDWSGLKFVWGRGLRDDVRARRAPAR